MKWLESRRARKVAEEEARREAQRRGWHEFWAAMHAASGGTPVTYEKPPEAAVEAPLSDAGLPDDQRRHPATEEPA